LLNLPSFKSSSLQKIIYSVVGLILALAPLVRFSWDIPTQIVVLLILATTFVILWSSCKIHIEPRRDVLLLFFYLAVVVSLVFAKDERAHVRNELVMLSGGLLAAYLFSFLSLDDKKKLLRVPLVTGFFLSVVTLVTGLQNVTTALKTYSFIESALFINVNVVAGYLVLVFPLSFIFSNDRTVHPVFRALLPVIIFLGIVITKSRIAIFTSFLCGLYLYWRFHRPGHLAKYMLLLFPVVAALLLAITHMKQLAFNGGMLTDRLLWWRSALAMFLEHPFSGIGWGNFGNLYLAYRPQLTVNTIFAHNLPVELMAETGIPGAMAMLAVLSYFFVACFRLIKAEATGDSLFLPILLSVGGFLMINMFDYSFFVPATQLLFWVLIGSVFSGHFELRNNPSAHRLLGAAALAVIYFYSAQPLLAHIQYRNGMYYQLDNNLDMAERSYLNAIRYDSLPSPYHAKIAEIHLTRYVNSGGASEIAMAIRAQNSAIKRFPSNAAYWADLGWLYRVAGEQDKARQALEMAVRYNRFNKKYSEALKSFNKENCH